MRESLRTQLAALGYRRSHRALPAGSVTVDVHVHVITRSDGSGNVTNAKITQQLAVLNAGFSGATATGASDTAFRFAVKSIDRTAKTDWYNWSVYSDNDDQQAKTALHRGGYNDLNVYIAGLQDGLLGYATFPNGALKLDGLVILNASMPGGAAAPYNEGDTASHEVGHWLGLLHTFENGCAKPGDMVSDTPYQDDGNNIYTCLVGDDTCPAKAGLDPVRNFMNYSEDACMNRFTPGQAQLMSNVWTAHRDPTPAPADGALALNQRVRGSGT